MAGLSQNEREIFIYMLKRLDTNGLREVRDLFRTAVDLAQRKAKLEFRRGDIVRFIGRGGEVHTGNVDKLLQKRVRVVEVNERGRVTATWKVSPSLLHTISRRA